jgi:hypothetical protein
MVQPLVFERRHSGGFLVSEQIPGTFSRQQVSVLQQVYTPPSSAPSLTPGSSGSLPTETVFVKTTYVTPSGETLPSAEASASVTGATGSCSVASPSAQSGVTGWNVYAANATGVEVLQNATPIAIGTAFNITTLATTGVFPPNIEPANILPAGLILGLISIGLTATAAARTTPANTGNGTMSAVTVSQGAIEGVYTVEFVSATEYNVISPAGAVLGQGVNGTAYSGAGGLAFTTTAGGTAFVAGDAFLITMAVNANNGVYAPLNLLAQDGSQIPAAVLFNETDASQSNVNATVIIRDAEVNGSELIYPFSATAAQIATINAQLATGAGSNIVVR